jgi:hypothetical protein
MRLFLALIAGIVASVVVVVGILVFTHAVTGLALQWASQTPPPPLTFSMRVLLMSSKLLARYWIPLTPVVFVTCTGISLFVASRLPRQ